MVRLREWSVRTWYSRPSRRADSTMTSSGSRPSDQSRVAVAVTAQVGTADQARQRARCGGLDLATALAQLGRDLGQAQEGVQLGLVGEGHGRRGVVVERDAGRAPRATSPARGRGGAGPRCASADPVKWTR